MYKKLRLLRRQGIVRKQIYRLVMVGFLYSLVNGITSYVLPIFLQESFNNAAITGAILASSSIWNILVDVVIGFHKKPPSYVYMMRLIGVLGLIGFLTLYVQVNILTLILVVFMWGVYTELYSFAVFDFVQALNDDDDRQAVNFGLMDNAYSLGALVAPIIASLVLLISEKLTLFTGIYLSIALVIVFNLFVILKRLPEPVEERKRIKTWISELKIWLGIKKRINDILVIIFVKGMSDGALTSFVPVMATASDNLREYAGLVLVSIYLPVMIFSGIFGDMADKKGKKNIILIGLLVSGLTLSIYGFASNVWLVCLLGFLFGMGNSMFNPASMAVESLYIKRHKSHETRVVGETGIYYNLGFIVGCSLCGILIFATGSYGVGFGVFGVFYLMAGLGLRKKLKRC